MCTILAPSDATAGMLGEIVVVVVVVVAVVVVVVVVVVVSVVVSVKSIGDPLPPEGNVHLNVVAVPSGVCPTAGLPGPVHCQTPRACSGPFD